MNEKCNLCQWFYTDADCCIHESLLVHCHVTHKTDNCIGFTEIKVLEDKNENILP